MIIKVAVGIALWLLIVIWYISFLKKTFKFSEYMSEVEKEGLMIEEPIRCKEVEK